MIQHPHLTIFFGFQVPPYFGHTTTSVHTKIILHLNFPIVVSLRSSHFQPRFFLRSLTELTPNPSTEKLSCSSFESLCWRKSQKLGRRGPVWEIWENFPFEANSYKKNQGAHKAIVIYIHDEDIPSLTQLHGATYIHKRKNLGSEKYS